MKNKLLLAIPVLALAGLAHAQSSVVLYGIADAGLAGLRSPNGTVARVISSAQSGSRWGIRGVEGLSDGLTAKFTLESGINVDDGTLGQGGLLFGRRATVGIWGAFGGVEVGRRDGPMAELLQALEPSGPAYNFGINDVLMNQTRGYQRRFNNQVRYESPTFSGFNASAMYSLGENNTAAGTAKARNDGFAFNGTYTGGPLFAGIAYQQTRDDANLGTGSAATVVTGLTPHKFRTGGVSYDFHVVKLFLFGYSDKRPGAVLSPEINQRLKAGGVQVPFLGNQVLAGSYAKIDDKTAANRDARQISLTYLYTLSRRTNFYVNAGSIRNDNYPAPNNVNNGFAYLSRALIDDSGKSRGWTVGVRHLF